MSYLNPDLAGDSPLHKVENDVREIFKTPQVFDFGTTVFGESIVLKMVDTTSASAPTTLVLGRDYQVLESDIDYDQMAKMKVYDPTFGKILCRSVTIYSNNTLNYLVNATYQRLYPNQIRTAYYNGEPLNFTPELLTAILQHLQHLELRTSKVDDKTGVTEHDARIYEIDIHMENPLNKVENEAHEMNASEGKIYIHPVGGAFYGESLVIKHPATNSTLIENQDYKIFSLDLHKTMLTSRKKPVYNFIIMLIPLNGDVTIDYHAFGGDPTVENIRDLKIQFQNIVAYLNEAAFITDSTLGRTKVITSLTARIAELEEDMRRLLLEGKPNYGDATSGQVVLKKLHASGDNNLHWWNIAKLYKVSGANDIINADRMRLRLETKYTKFMMDVIISVNLNNPSGNRFDVVIESDIYPKGYIPLEDYSGVDTLIRPQFRAIWNANSTQQSGIIIQFGMELKSVSTETLVIVDNSGTESCFIIDLEVDDILLPNDDIVQLPNPNHVWDMSNENSKWESTLAPFTEGHLVWAGVKPLNRPDGEFKHFMLTDHFLDNNTDYTRIKKVRLELCEVGTAYQFPIDIDFIPGKENLVGFKTFHYNKRPAYINMRIYRDDLGDIQFDFNTEVEAGLESNQLDIRGVVIYV